MWVLEAKLAITISYGQFCLLKRMASSQNKAGTQMFFHSPKIRALWIIVQIANVDSPHSVVFLISVYLADLFPLYKTSSITILKDEIIFFTKTSLTVVVFVHWHDLHLASCLYCGPGTTSLDKATWTELLWHSHSRFQVSFWLWELILVRLQ